MRFPAKRTPRDLSQEADDLSNLRTGAFDHEKRVELNMEEERWIVFTDIIKVGMKLHYDKEEKKEDRRREE